MIAALALVLFQGDAPSDLADALAQGRHQLAMAAAARLEDGPRLAAEAEVLYLARSYDEALWKVQDALEAGVTPDCTLLSRGVSAAIWVGDQDAGRQLLASMDTAIAALDESERAAWRGHAEDLKGFLDDQAERTRDTGAARWRAQATTVGVGLLALLVLAGGLRSWRRS